ncbi:MAG: hypothetical protein E7593_01530 [Ruminococcaceae bacterium]|nr:hypothetical protein [Oscillospiraceae bacterium]
MMNDKRELLTKKYVKEELLFYNSADIKSGILAIVMTLSIVLIMSFLFVAIIPSFSIVILSMFLLLDFGFAYCIFLELKEKKVIESDGFEVVTDKVLYKWADFRREIGSRSGRTIRLIHLEHFGDIRVGSTEYDLATNGDIYYVVVCHYKKSRPVLFYPDRTHVYKESKW